MNTFRPNEKSVLISYRDESIQGYTSDFVPTTTTFEKGNGCGKGAIAMSVGVFGFIISMVLIMQSSVHSRFPVLRVPTPVSKISIKQVTHPEQPSPLWGAVSKPYPSGAFWTNLVVKNGDGPIAVLPYGIKCVDAGLQVSYCAFRRIVSPVSVFDPFVTDLQISATQGYIGRSVDTYDNISVTMSYRTGANGRFRAHLVKGSPFVTVIYEGATPVITANVMQIINVEARLVKGSIGIQYIVTLGNSQKWLVYCSEPVAFTWKDNTLTAPSAIRGMIRVANLPLQNSDNAFNFLLGYIQKYPTGAAVSLSYPTSTTMVTTIQYYTQGNGPLLMLALPHHLQLLSNMDTDEIKLAQATYTSIYAVKGRMKPVIGEIWKLNYNLVNVGWHYTLYDKLSNAQLDSIAYWLQQEVKMFIPSAADTYSFGKEIGRMARLALIADNLGIADARQTAIQNMEQSLNPWVQSTNLNPLLYDRTWGGVVSTRGISDPSMGADYGLGWYNDHHFHYGYFIYAFAVLARIDPPFVEARRSFMELLVRDVCNYDPTDVDFPVARHKDFFDGHSWASGLIQQANGKNQESSSEAVNAYYACYLYGLATSNTDLTNFAHSLLTMEVQATQMYWHMGSDNPVYDDVFKVSRMAGNVGALDVTASTWFGNAPEYVHGINIMPVTPALALLLDQPYVEQQWQVLAPRIPPPLPTECSKNSACAALPLQGNCCPTVDGVFLGCCDAMKIGSGRMQDEWLGLMYADHAVVDRDTAWNQILTLSVLGPGNSKANSLFWAASRPPPRPTYNSSNKPLTPQQTVKAACAANSACDAMGMVDDCCPSALGTYLGCCPKTSILNPLNL